MDLIPELKDRIARRPLLGHPFYVRWTEGSLTRAELARYATEYYHYALAFPTFLSAIHARSEDLSMRQLLLENLIEEERGAENHPELWLRFCEALGLDRQAVVASRPSPSTSALIATMRALASTGSAHEGLAALYAYESQVPAVAKTKIEGLARWYGIAAPRDVAFFAVHLEADVAHARTAEELLERLCTTPAARAQAQAAVDGTLGALYSFLDGVTPAGACAAA
jgi:pyrroloquinoline-quinone synthase